MSRQREQRCLWAWHLSALVYEWSYVQVAHQIDEDFLGYLSERLIGAVVADCGCGPGVVTEKLLQAGAARVVAIDANASMIERVRARLAKGVAAGKVLVCHGKNGLPAGQHLTDHGGRWREQWIARASMETGTPAVGR